MIDLRYLDDTTVVAESRQELRSVMAVLEQESRRVGLRINVVKTKVMAINEAEPVNILNIFVGCRGGGGT